MKTVSHKIRLTLLAGILLTGWGQSAHAQVSVSGSNGADASNYANLGAAFTSIVAGDQTGKTIAITLDQTSIVETASAILTNKGWTALTIRPSVAGVTVSGAVDGALIKLDGAQNVKIDGRIGGTGTTKDLTISNTSVAVTATQTILLINDAKNNVIEYATIKGTNSATLSGTISITTGLVDGNDNNTIDNCDLCEGATLPVCPIFLSGTSATISNDGTVISNCSISNYLNTGASTVVAGIYITGNCNTSTIENNRFFWTTPMVPAAASTVWGMIVRGNLNTVKNNVVGYADKFGNGTAQIGSATLAMKVIGIQMTGGNSFEGISTVTNNTVSNIDLLSNSAGDANIGVLAGFYTQVLAGSYINYTGNTVKNLKLTFSGTRAANVYWNIIGMISLGSNCTYLDNSIHDLSIVGTTAGNMCLARGISITGAVYTTDLVHNSVYNISSGDLTSTAANSTLGLQCSTQSTINMERNTIYNLSAHNSLGTAVVHGISTSQSLATSQAILLIKNNMIALGNDMVGGTQIFGISQAAFASTAAHAYYLNNSVSISGKVNDGLTTGATVAFSRTVVTGAPAIIDLKNNIFSNTRVGGLTGNHYAIRLATTADYLSAYITCNNNLYQIGNGTNNKLGAIGNGVAAPSTVYTDYASYSDWKTNCVGFDANSSLNNPQFVDPTNLITPNLHIRTDVGTPVKGAGEDLSTYMFDDIDGDSRAAGPFDIGADANPAFTIPVFEFGGFSIPADGKYEVGNNLDFLVNYTMPVIVTGTPSIPITLNTGGIAQATYVTGSGTTQIKFVLTVSAGQVDADGIELGNAIALNGGSIKNEGGTDAILALPAKNTTGIQLDGDAAASILSMTQPVNKTFPSLANLDFKIRFSNFVTVTPGTYVDEINTGIPQLDLTVGTKKVAAAYISGSGTKELLFRYTTVVNDVDADGIDVASAINLNGGTIQDAALKNAIPSFPALTTTEIKVKGTVPTILSIVPSGNGIYGLGAAIFFTVTFSEPLYVTTGTPQLKIVFSDSFTTGAATYISGNGTNTFLLRSTIPATAQDLDGIDIVSPMLATNGTVQDVVGNNLDLNYTAPNTSGIYVDFNALPPTITSVTSVADGQYSAGQNIDFTVNYDAAVDVTGTPSLVFFLSGSAKKVEATYASGSGTSAIVFRYTIVSGDLDLDGISLVTESSQFAIHFNGGVIKASGNSFVSKVNFTTVAPVLTGITVDATTGIKTVEADALTVFNVDKTLYVKGTIRSNATATIYDLCGKAVATHKLMEGSDNAVNVSSLKGLYIVAINNNGKRTVAKVIVP